MKVNLPTTLFSAGLALIVAACPVPAAADHPGGQDAKHEARPAEEPRPSLNERFFSAIWQQDAGALKACLAEGVDPNRILPQKDFQVYPLQLAGGFNWGEGMLVLLDAGADPLQKGDRGTTVIIHGLFPCPIEVLPRLLEAGAMEGGLFLAVHNHFYGNCEEAQRILAEWRQVSPLMKAALAGDTPAMRRLLAEGADPSAPDKAGTTPLMYAAASGKADGVELLLQAGADPHAVDICGDTALHYAAVRGCGGAARLLCQAGAATDTEDGYNWAPLKVAIFKGNAEVVEALLEAGVKPAPEDAAMSVRYTLTSGWSACATPLLIFNEKEPAFCEMSFADGGPYLSGVPSATILRMLVGAGATFDKELGAEMLSAAASDDNADIVRCLLELGVEPDARSSNGYTALMGAELECTRILLEAGADANASTESGDTVLGYALARGSWGREKVRLLLEAGADASSDLNKIRKQIEEFTWLRDNDPKNAKAYDIVIETLRAAEEAASDKR